MWKSTSTLLPQAINSVGLGSSFVPDPTRVPAPTKVEEVRRRRLFRLGGFSTDYGPLVLVGGLESGSETVPSSLLGVKVGGVGEEGEVRHRRVVSRYSVGGCPSEPPAPLE